MYQLYYYSIDLLRLTTLTPQYYSDWNQAECEKSMAMTCKDQDASLCERIIYISRMDSLNVPFAIYMA